MTRWLIYQLLDFIFKGLWLRIRVYGPIIILGYSGEISLLSLMDLCLDPFVGEHNLWIKGLIDSLFCLWEVSKVRVDFSDIDIIFFIFLFDGSKLIFGILISAHFELLTLLESSELSCLLVDVVLLEDYSIAVFAIVVIIGFAEVFELSFVDRVHQLS